MMVGNNIEELPASIPGDAHHDKHDSPTFKAHLAIVVRDKDGKIINIHKQKSHSPTANFISLFLPISYFSISGSTTTVITESNSNIKWSTPPYYLGYPDTAGVAPAYLAMIQVGSGQQSNPYSAYNLAAPIANGNGSGQLSYGPPSILPNVVVSGNSVSFVIYQTFTNSSGATITITEVGVVIELYVMNTSNQTQPNLGPVLVWYDTLSSPISIPNGGAITIFYTFTVNP